MAKKPRKTVEDIAEDSSTSKATKKASSLHPAAQSQPQPFAGSLIICRNKHWRYISCFNGPWLQLPPEVLDTLANTNYNLPRPRPIDPAVFFDLVKIRRLVDEATNLSVRAANGVTASGLANFRKAGNGQHGNGDSTLGLCVAGGGGNAKLSRERKHRMREQVTQKLSRAYHLDEIACSVATMQAASTLEDVAQLVLQRNPLDPDAKYVHFFHEKIPSRQLVECTSLLPLDDIILERPTKAAPLRTRANIKVFREDYAGAAQDLTSALQVHRHDQGFHKAGEQQIQRAYEGVAQARRINRRKEELTLREDDQPSSLEAQLLFQRAGVYLTIACQHITSALPMLASKSSASFKPEANESNAANGSAGAVTPNETHFTSEETEETLEERGSRRKKLEARNMVKTNAKKALRDYIAFLSHLEYTPGLSTATREDFVDRVNQAAREVQTTASKNDEHITEKDDHSSLSKGKLSAELVPHQNSHSSRSRLQNGSLPTGIPSLPSPRVYEMSSLFFSTPPEGLPSYPATETDLATRNGSTPVVSPAAQVHLDQPEYQEGLTYHPLLTDALHSLLLCHCLIQTSAKELQRHAHMVARLARLCDGYPLFRSSRSPSRADWIELLRRCDNLVVLTQPWATLCAPVSLPIVNEQKETPEQHREKLKKQAVLEALEDDRVHDEESFHAAIRARQRAQDDEARKAQGIPRRRSQEDVGDSSIGSERAHAVARWIKEALPPGEGGMGKKKKRRPAEKSIASRLESSTASLKVADDGGYEVVYEEVD